MGDEAGGSPSYRDRAPYFAVAIRAHNHASYVDWRADYGALSYEPIPVPTDVQRGIRAVMRELNLVYGAFDFVITGSGMDLS